VFFSTTLGLGAGALSFGKIGTKQISFYIIYSGSNQIKAQKKPVLLFLAFLTLLIILVSLSGVIMSLFIFFFSPFFFFYNFDNDWEFLDQKLGKY
jgi:hypothetical protein